MAKILLTVSPGYTIVVNDPETNQARHLKAGESWQFEDDAETADYVKRGVLREAQPAEVPPQSA